MVTFRGRRYFVDVRLGELREVDILTPLPFEEFERTATSEELAMLVVAVFDYYRQFEEDR
jgi:hypothetical protein